MSELLCKWCFGGHESVSEWMVYGLGGVRVSPFLGRYVNSRVGGGLSGCRWLSLGVV